MTTTRRPRAILMAFLGLAALVLMATPSSAQTSYNLCASDGTVTMPDGTVVDIWGYADIGAGSCTLGLATLPGPELRATAGETVTINLSNALAVPVSFFVPGYRATVTGGFVAGDLDQGDLTAETPAAGSATYTISPARAGTYLYHSGTDITTQVPMGLYGALVVDEFAGQAYSDVSYDQDQVLVYSEIDPKLNDGSYGAMGARVINWSPQYFLINGKAAPDTDHVVVAPSTDVLLRFVNAGLESFMPTLDGGLFMDLVAEDGNRYPQPLQQYGIELPAGKTIDALVNVTDEGSFALYDRALHLADGLLTYLDSTAGAGLFELSAATYSVGEGAGTLTVTVKRTGGSAGAVAVDYATVDGSATGLDYTATSGTLNWAHLDDTDKTFAISILQDVAYEGDETFVVGLNTPTGGATLGTPASAVVTITDDDVAAGTLQLSLASYSVAENGASVTVTVDRIGGATGDATVDYATADGSATTAGLDYDATSGTLTFFSGVTSQDIVITINDDGDYEGDETFGLTLSNITGGATLGTPAGAVITITEDETPVVIPPTPLPGLTVIGVAADGTETPLTAYRWLVEENLFYQVPMVGGVPQPDENTSSVSFHRSYMPVVAKGCVGMPAGAACKDVPFADSGSHYYVSVVPRSGYSIGGADYVPGVGATVYVNEWAIPTAQISILIFEDNFSINNAPDLPVEDPTTPGNTDMSGFQVVVEDAGGRYGASSGVQSQDAFGNPLGTTYDAAGNVLGYAPLITGPDGRITIQNLAPGKYGISAVPPAGVGWQQTSTIEGTKIIDAWVKANEPPFFAEFGPPGFHAFIGFVKEFTDPFLTGGSTITGTVVNQHLSRPPQYAFFEGGCFGHTTPWVGLNELNMGIPGRGLYAAPTDEDCNFAIPDVPDGNYQLVFWDNNMDLIFAFKGITIDGGACSTPLGSCDLGKVPVFQWFHRQEHFVYNDLNADGLYQPADGETPILEQAVLLRWRDGTVYQENVSDPEGLYAFDQVFPFFSWLVAEVDFARFEATSLTVVADNGGQIPTGATVAGIGPEGDVTFGDMTNPQDQTNPADPDCTDPAVCTETATHRTDLGPVLTAGFQGFIGQTHGFQWGKRHYADGENGGISGIVFYAITRAEDDPEMAAAEPWEPGVPGVTVNLYESLGIDPLTGVAARGALLASGETDSWDDSLPTGCKWGNGATGPFHFDPDGPDGPLGVDTDCYDGLRNFNQVRPAVFDGGYAFGPQFDCAEFPAGTCGPDGWLTATGFIKPGDYIVEMIPPIGYEILKPEDKNVDFGDEYQKVAAVELLPAPCVGDLAEVPEFLTLFPDEAIPAPFAGTSRPLCDRKLVSLSAGANAAADFWLFTEVPVAAHGHGFILDDTQNEFDPNSPQFGEKYAPPFVPVTIRDWTGRIIGKTLSDQYGVYNFLGPSTITTNLPAPSGMSPNMLTTCMNDPGDDPANPDPNHNQQYSTFCYNFQYMPGATTYLDTPVVPVAAFTGPDQFPLDCEQPDGTPRIFSVSVNNGVGGGPYVPRRGGGGGRVRGNRTITITSMGERLVQNPDYCNAAAGTCPAGADTVNKFITRDFGFGDAPGTLTITRNGVDMAALGTVSWSDSTITVALTNNTVVGGAGGFQLDVTRANGQSTATGVTVQLGLRGQAGPVIAVTPDPNPLATPIQDAITAARANSLILVSPGQYNEMVVMWKPVQLQGWGEGSTTINAVKAPTDKLQAWRDLVDGLVNVPGLVDLVPGQEIGGGAPEPGTLQTEEGAGVLVLAPSTGAWAFGGASSPNRNRDARIDGFTIKSADTGGGIIVNGYGKYLDISNNRIANNSGFYGGGIRVGHPTLTAEDTVVPGGCPDGALLCYPDADNDFVDIRKNSVVFNGGLGGAGGGISMCTGSESYQVTENFVCGNFTLRNGGGIGHTGFSEGSWRRIGSGASRYWVPDNVPLIADNTVIFNESFFQGQTVSGGGIFIGGAPPLLGTLSPGAGYVQVVDNLIQGNSAGAGDGGGIRVDTVNGQEVADNPNNTAPRNRPLPGNVGNNSRKRPWHSVDVFNNLIVNNVAGLAGGGISMQDAVDVRLLQNTIANNDSLAVAGQAFLADPNQSTPQPGAGIVTRSHSGALAGSSGNIGTFSDPTAFANNIIWQNRQFYFFVDATSGCTPADPGCLSTYGLCPDVNGGLACPGGNAIVYDDLAVLGTAGTLACDPAASCILTGDPDPQFVAEYANGDRASVFQPEVTTAIQTPPAFDEGGNFIRPNYGPLALYDDPTANDGLPGSLFGDYHIQETSSAVDTGAEIWTLFGLTDAWDDLLWWDFDTEPRPSGLGVDIGADEVQSAACGEGIWAPWLGDPGLDEDLDVTALNGVVHGMDVVFSAAGGVAGVHWYASDNFDTGETVTVGLWDSGGTLLASRVTTSYSVGAWNYTPFTGAVLVSAGPTYRVGRHVSSTDAYSGQDGYHGGAITSGSVTVPANGSYYDYGAFQQPTSQFGEEGYGIDVEFCSEGGPPPPEFGALQLSAATYSADENGGDPMVMVERVGGSDGSVTVVCATADGTATVADLDYTAATNLVTFGDGVTLPQPCPITILDDPDYEGDETFSIALNTPTGGAILGTPASAVVTITDDETPPTVGDPEGIWEPWTGDPGLSQDFDGTALGGVGHGMDVVFSVAGVVEGVHWYASTGFDAGETITVALWDSGGALLASQSTTAYSTGAWNYTPFATALPVSAATTYRVGRHTTSTNAYAGQDFYHPDASGNVSAPASYYSYGAFQQPTDTYNQEGYGVDVQFRAAP